MKEKADNRLWLASIVGEIGFLIAIPLVLFALLGRFLDQVFGSFPLFFLIGILLAIVSSTYIVYKRTSALLKESEETELKTEKSETPTSYKLPPTS